jgi:hypothetical protein
MEKRTLIALLLVAALGVGAFAVMRAPEKGQRQGPPPRPIPALKAADFTKLEVTTDKQEPCTLERGEGGKWLVKAAAQWPADQGAVKQTIDALERMTFGDLVSDNPAKQEELGVGDKAPRLKVYTGANLVADLIVGKALGGFTLVRLGGKKDVWQAGGLFVYQVNKAPKDWRDHTIVELAAADVKRLTVQSGGAKLVLERDEPKPAPAEPTGDPAKKDAKEAPKPAAEAKWKIAESVGDGPKTEGALDAQEVQNVVSSLASLKASDFADDKKPEETGVDAPTITVTAVAKDKTYSLVIGATKGEDTYVKSDGPTVYALKKFAVERIARRPIDFRDKTIAKVKEADLAGVDIAQGQDGKDTTSLERAGDKWKLKSGSADDAKVRPVVSAFESLIGSGFSPEKDPQKTGLQKPKATVTLVKKDKSRTVIKVGAQTKDQADYYVQRVGSPDILLVKKYNIDRFLKKPAELAAK